MTYEVILLSLSKALWIIALAGCVSAVLSMIVSTVQSLISHPRLWSVFTKNFFLIFFASIPFSIVGVVIGYLTGASKAPAVTALIPAILTFLGGLAI